MTFTLEKPLARALSSGHPPEFHWTVDAFYKAFDAGVFGDDARLELIQGRLMERMPPGPAHCYLADIIADMLRSALDKNQFVREEKPIHIAFDGEPIPDISIFKGQIADYRSRHPSQDDTLLVVEVSVTTAEYDLGEKALLYSQAGINEYWVVLVNEAAIVLHRQPTSDGYESIVRLSGVDIISPLALPQVSWSVNALLSRSETTGAQN